MSPVPIRAATAVARFSRRLFAAAALIAMAFPAVAQTYKLGDLEIAQPWTRATPSTARTAGGFLAITNKGASADRLMSAASPVSLKVEVHEMKMEGSVMRMREIDKGLEIPPGATVVLKPGGYHLMFMELKAPIAQGARVPVALVFEKAGRIDVELAAEAMGAAQPGHQRH
ncbi:MAG: copper chaperone PCu(A)C [Enhydrobacter sp.]|nr:MAG: copper chaperone PCu(A)C [Enhydrobacter sp.]